MDKIWNISSIYQLNMNLVKTILVNIKDETESWQTNQKTKLVFPLLVLTQVRYSVDSSKMET